MTDPRLVPCPLCKKDVPRPLIELNEPFMRIVKCQACGMMYQSPQMPESSIEDAHTHFEEYTHYPDLNPAKTRLFEARIRRMAKAGLIPGDGSFLDVGTGYGAMLDAMAAALPPWRRMAIEISDSARTALASRGHASVAQAEDLAPDARFDWINLDNVLEHLPNPMEALADLRTRLKPGGMVYVEVPNEFLIHFKYVINDWARGFPKPPTFPGHMSLFTKRTLRSMGKQAGFQRIHIWQEAIGDPWRLEALAGMKPTGKLKAILAFLRWTRMDKLLGLGYFLCARFEA